MEEGCIGSDSHNKLAGITLGLSATELILGELK